jgi:hypothetical protein
MYEIAYNPPAEATLPAKRDSDANAADAPAMAAAGGGGSLPAVAAAELDQLQGNGEDGGGSRRHPEG